MIKVGLTGNTCSGYERVATLFKTLGVPVFDADVALKFLLTYREDIARKIRVEFGEGVFNKGLIIASRFNSTQKFDKLVDIVELDLLKLYETWRFVNKDANYTIFKSSILFERKLNKSMNYNISVFRPRDERALALSKLCIRRDSPILHPIKLSEAFEIIESEMDELTKNQIAEYTIHNYEGQSIMNQVKDIHKKIEDKSIKKLLSNMHFGVGNMLS